MSQMSQRLFLHSISLYREKWNVHLCLFFSGLGAVRVVGYFPFFLVDIHGWSDADINEYLDLLKNTGRDFVVSYDFVDRYPSYFHFNRSRKMIRVRYTLGKYTRQVQSDISQVTLSSGARHVRVFSIDVPLLFVLENPGLALHSWVNVDIAARTISWKPGCIAPVADDTLGYHWAAIRVQDSRVVVCLDRGDDLEFDSMAGFKSWLKTSAVDTFVSFDDTHETFLTLNKAGCRFSLLGEDEKYANKRGEESVRVTGRNCVDLRRNQVMKAFVSPKLEGFYLADVVDHLSFHPETNEHPKTLLQEAQCLRRIIVHSKQMEQGAAISRLAHVNLEVTFHRGQQARIFNILQESAFQNEFFIDLEAPRVPMCVSNVHDDFKDPDISVLRRDHVPDADEQKNKRLKMENAAKKQYAGGFVHDPVPGYYTDGVWICDFESLYPNIIIAYSLCYAAILQSDVSAVARSLGLTTKDKLTIDDLREMGVGIRYVSINEQRSVGVVHSVSGNRAVTFADKAIAKLLALRKKTKALMKTAATPAIRDNLDSQQQAMKASANAGYGFWGTPSEYQVYNYLAIAAVVCSIGRFMNKTCARYVHDNYQARIVYGDSVVGTTALLLRRHGVVTVRSIENLWAESGSTEETAERQYLDLDGWETWTERGWTKIQRIMRHRTDKAIVRVLTHTGCVDVTEDHSLVRADGTEAKPGDVRLGDTLLHSFPREWPEVPSKISLAEAEIMGFFMGDGSCGAYPQSSGGVKYTWALNSNNMEIMRHLRDLCIAAYPQFDDFSIMDTLASSGVYKLSPRGGEYGSNRDLTLFYSAFLYDGSRSKVVPDAIISAPIAVRQAFWKGYYAADGDTQSLGRCDAKHEVSALSLYVLMSSLGLSCSVNTRADKPDVYRVTGTASKQRRNPVAIKKLVPMGPCRGFVYDLTTENHHFQAGVGSLIVHNTDSIMFTRSSTTWDEANRMCEEMSALFPRPIKIVVEGLLSNALFIRSSTKTGELKTGGVQKNYIGFLSSKPDDPDAHIKMQGVSGKRRDRCPAIRSLACQVYDLIVGRKISDILPLVYERLLAFARHEIPLADLTVTCRVAAEYVNETLHIPALARRIEARTGQRVREGTRIPFVFITGDHRSETPEFIMEFNRDAPREKKIRVDWAYYIETQLAGVVIPMLQEFRPLLLKFIRDYPSYMEFAKGIRGVELRDALAP
jgi:hypothetical protein